MTTNFVLEGRVKEGMRIGRTLGFPTANIELRECGVKFGVYAARILISGEWHYGVLSVGVKPTIAEGLKPIAECHIFDFQGDIYNKTITIETLAFLREEQKFSSLDKLRSQIQLDVQKTQTIIRGLLITDPIITNYKTTMKKSVKGTRTEKNLLAAFAGESQARNRYTMYAKQAKKDGYEVIAKFFLETAENERQHAKQFFTFLEGGMVEITSTYPAGVIGTTIENLREAAQGEYDEWYELYPAAADIAQEEGFEDIALKFRQIASIEKHHEERYRGLLATVEAEAFFKKEEEQIWRCRECGYEHVGTDALEMCPVCNHAQPFQEIKCDRY